MIQRSVTFFNGLTGRARTPSPHSEDPISRSAPAMTTGKTIRPSARVAGVIRSRNVGLVFDERQAFSLVANRTSPCNHCRIAGLWRPVRVVSA